MEPSLILSRNKVATFTSCRRRFQLRYLQQLAWPAPPAAKRDEKARALGERFHQLLHRHFLGLPLDEEVTGDKTLHRWWEAFQAHPPSLLPGRRYPEFTLTVPAAPYLLTGRFDLLIVSPQGAHVYDWKTEAKPRPQEELRHDLQTRFYLALLVVGSAALGQSLSPGQVGMSYWYVNAPQATVTIQYDEAWHAANWADLQKTIREIAVLENAGTQWPLTDDISHCAQCLYQVCCGRQGTAYANATWEWETEPVPLEPDWP
jgi:CRISPR/Cas system-associated exonuclease Cas4 (RecB family)